MCSSSSELCYISKSQSSCPPDQLSASQETHCSMQSVSFWQHIYGSIIFRSSVTIWWFMCLLVPIIYEEDNCVMKSCSVLSQFKFKYLSVSRKVHSLFQTDKRSPKSAILSLSPDEASRIFFGERLSRKCCNVVVFPFAFYIAVQQLLKPLCPHLLLCNHEPSQPSTILCFMSLLKSLLPTSGEFVSQFPSPMVILSFFPPPWLYWLGWVCQDLKSPPASLSGSWGVSGPPTMSRW
jgi:hypothetical protein